MTKIKELTSNFHQKLTDQEIKLITQFQYDTSNFYGLPKIHNSCQIIQAISNQNSALIKISNPSDLKLRPIIAGPNCPTNKLSHFIDMLLQPLAHSVTAYVKDDSDILRKLPTALKDNIEMATLDVENLNGSINHETGLEAVKFWMETVPRETSRISNNFILASIRIILENNIFQFNGSFYRQRRGTAMGTKMAPIYATLTLGFLERKLYLTIHNNYKFDIYKNFIQYYFRYLDDILVLYDKEALPVNEILNLLNNICPDLKFNLETSGEAVNFLDIKIIKHGNTKETNLFSKCTDTKQYLNFRSNHPRHVKRALPYNLGRRICTIVSNNNKKKLNA